MERKDVGLPQRYQWGVHFAARTIPGRNGVEKGRQFPNQDRFSIRHMVPHDHATPFSELHFVDTVRFPTRALADTCIGAGMDIERARVFLKRELEKGAALDAAVAS